MLKLVNRMQVRDERGFTLVELLIVIAIIAILAAIAIPQFAQYRQRGIRASMQSDAKNCATQAESWFADNQTYSTFDSTVISNSCKASSGNTITNPSPAASTYSITVSNSNGGSGSGKCIINEAGTFSWAS